ncbi:MAG TPA: 2-isopropylmalate synthase [Candidatus Limnocylindrales bacterium]|nr:2-isopropylmalate synthase [Candidatus Limnocylindrales bacterium]
MSEKVIIFDTTLRDGEQSPGASMNIEEKMQMARQLARLNVDVIEAGFPIASEGDFLAVKEIAQEIKGPIIAALARTTKQDIDRAWEALKYAERFRIHTFIATSDIHVKYKLRKTREEVLEDAINAVKRARNYTDDVEFSPEDAGRTKLDFLCKVIEEVIKAGATTINIPDTVGYTIPWEFGDLIAQIRNRVPNIDKAILSVHCHNDLGLAVANSLAAIKNGARQVECTINGIGERAGNASLEEIVMAIKTRKDLFNFVHTDIKTEEIYRTSRLLTQLTGLIVQRNKAIVGENAFAHEAGIHQDGVLKEKLTYEIMTPESIGRPSNELVLGKHSGRHAFRNRLEELGYKLSEEQLNEAFKRFKDLADKKKEIYDEDLQVIAGELSLSMPEAYTLEYLGIIGGTGIVPTATVKIRRGDQVVQQSGCGDGPVEAAYRAIDTITGIPGRLKEYSIRAVTKGKDAIGEALVVVDFDGQLVSGKGSSTDVIEASAKAYLNAVNKVVMKRGLKEVKDEGP